MLRFPCKKYPIGNCGLKFSLVTKKTELLFISNSRIESYSKDKLALNPIASLYSERSRSWFLTALRGLLLSAHGRFDTFPSEQRARMYVFSLPFELKVFINGLG